MGPDAGIADLLASGLEYCRVVAVDNGSLIGALFLAGLAGGLSHCAAMCGPFVMSQVTARLETTTATTGEFGRLMGAALMPYQVGRMTTYVLLGVAATLGSSGLVKFFTPLAPLLLLIAALAFALQGLRTLWPQVFGKTAGSTLAVPGIIRRAVQKMSANPVGWRGYGLGLVLGFLPCGLLYGALAGAAGSADVLAAAMAMAAFAAGTMPTLVGIGYLGDYLRKRSALVGGVLAPVLMLLNAGVLAWIAWGMFPQ